jgi:TctA family transporter
MISALTHIADPALLLAMLAAVLFAQVVAITPGLGGAFLLAMLIPFVFGLDPFLAIAVLVAASATDGTGNTVTSILFGVPGSATAAAMVIDGHPMAKRGQAGRAIGAALTASAIGGVIGALVLAVIIPIARPFVLAFGPVEFFVFVIFALFTLALVREEHALKGLIGAALGLSLSLVGMSGSTGVQRYTFDQLYLWDGLKLVPVLLGLFAITEAINMLKKARELGGGSLVDRSEAVAAERAGTLEGMKDAFRHWDATLLGSWVGLIVGMLPGVGGAAGQFMAYSTVAKMTRVGKRMAGLPSFGKGNVRGVIGPDAATNSTSAGELVPVLAFGIPGSSTTAILLGALVVMGIQPGPRMLQFNMDIVWTIIFVLVLGNLMATGSLLLVARHLARLAYVRTSLLGPAILAIALFAAYATSRHIGDILVAVTAAFVGYFLKKYGFGVVTFLIGFVLGPILEHYLVLSLQVYGPGFIFARPLAMVLLAALVLMVARSAYRSYRQRSLAEGAPS